MWSWGRILTLVSEEIIARLFEVVPRFLEESIETCPERITQCPGEIGAKGAP